MTQQHKISEYIENLDFKKTLGGGLQPDEVYEAIRKLTSMYNEVLAEAYQELAELRATLERREATTPPPTYAYKPSEPSYAYEPSEPAFDYEATTTPAVYESPALSATTVATHPASTNATQDAPDEEHVPAAADLKRMNRYRLLELLLECSRKNADLHKEIQELQEQKRALQLQLEDKRIKLDKAGTLAEASLLLNGVVEATQAAASQYLENLRDLELRETVRCEEKEAQAQRQADRLLENARIESEGLIRRTQEQCSAMEAQTRNACAAMKDSARAEIDKHWAQLSEKLEEFYNAHEGLKDLLRYTGQMPGGDHV